MIHHVDLFQPLIALTLVVLLAVQNSEDSQEQVNDVKVKRDRGCNLLLDVVVSHDELSINQNVAAEDEGADNAVAQLDSACVGEEGCHESENNNDPESSCEIRNPAGKVIFGLAGEQREGDKDSESKDKRL